MLACQDSVIGMIRVCPTGHPNPLVSQPKTYHVYLLYHYNLEGYFLLEFFPVFPGFCTGRKGGRKEGRKEGRKDGQEGRKEGRQAGRKEGRKEGRKAGRQEGRKEGRQAGRKEGRKEGRQAGRKEGRKEVSRMLLILCQLNEWLHPKTSEVT